MEEGEKISMLNEMTFQIRLTCFLILNRNSHYSLEDSYRLTSVLIDIFISQAPDPNKGTEKSKNKDEQTNTWQNVLLQFWSKDSKSYWFVVANSLCFFSL